MNIGNSNDKWAPILLAAVSLFTVTTPIFADATTPIRGCDERKAILDAVRAPLESDINQKVIFVVDHMKVDGDWAFVKATPKTKDGRPIIAKERSIKKMPKRRMR